SQPCRKPGGPTCGQRGWLTFQGRGPSVSRSATSSSLEHDPEKWIPVFGKACPRARPEGSCSTNKLERDDDSKKSHLALVRFGAQLFDDRPPLVQLGFEKRGQLDWCRACGNRADVCEPLPRWRMRNRRDSIDVHLSDDLSRGLGRQEKCVPGRYVKSGYA